MATLLTIGEVAARSGLRTSTLRYYDRIGLVPATVRRGGQRRNSPSTTERLRAVTLCQRSGFSLEEISRPSTAAGPGGSPARGKLDELHARIAELEETAALPQSALDVAVDARRPGRILGLQE